MIGAIIQARCNSTRLKNKVLLKIPVNGDKNILERIVDSIQSTKSIDSWCVATSSGDENSVFFNMFPGHVFVGSESNVLERLYLCAKKFKFKHIIRLTGDNPCIDPNILDNLILRHLELNSDYTKTIGLPIGMNLEIISFKALLKSFEMAKSDYAKEHVTSFVNKNRQKFNINTIQYEQYNHLKDIRLTVDYPNDYLLVNLIFGHIGPEKISIETVENFFKKNKWAVDVNLNYQKKEYQTIKDELIDATQVLKKYELLNAIGVLNIEITKLESLDE